MRAWGLLLAASMLVARAAHADPGSALDASSKAAARALGYEGVEAYERGEYAVALEKLDRAYGIVAVPTLGLWSARAMVKRGMLVEAAERYLEVAHLKVLVGDASVQSDAQREAEAERTALNPRIPALRVGLVGKRATEAIVALDGRVLEASLVGVEIGVNPGAHDVEVRAPGSRSPIARRSFTVREGQRETISFDLASTTSEVVVDARPPPSGASTRTVRLASAVALGGVGVVNVIVGAVFAGVAASRWSSAQAACPASITCPSNEASDLSRRARSDAQAANVALALGAGALAGAAILWFAAPSASASSARVGIGLGPGSLIARGTF